VQAHRARRDQLLQVASRELGRHGGQRAIEPLAVLGRGHGERAGFRFRSGFFQRLFSGVDRYNGLALFLQSDA